jgi:hypothetical protein
MLTSYADANVQLGLPILDAENEATDYPWPVPLMSIPGEDGFEELGPVAAIACGLDSSYVTMQVCVYVRCVCVCFYAFLSLARSLALCVSPPMSRCMCVCLGLALREHTSACVNVCSRMSRAREKARPITHATYAHVCLVCDWSCFLSRSRSLLVTSYATMQNGQVRAMGSSKYGQTGQGNQGNCQVLRLGFRA